MKVYLMDLLPYGQHFDQFKADRFIPYPLPGRHFDPKIAARTYEEHFAIWAEMDALAVISNCPQVNNPCNGFNPTPIRVQIT